eukprot:3883482-Pyramimonas_sp.AAC.1
MPASNSVLPKRAGVGQAAVRVCGVAGQEISRASWYAAATRQFRPRARGLARPFSNLSAAPTLPPIDRTFLP